MKEITISILDTKEEKEHKCHGCPIYRICEFRTKLGQLELEDFDTYYVITYCEFLADIKLQGK